MILHILHELAKYRVVLASSSPRRKAILQNIGLAFEVIPSTFEETLDKNSFASPIDFVKETAKQKALQVASSLKKDRVKTDIVIGADTVVTFEDEIFGKPKDTDDAISVLRRFSGKSHVVYTGVTIIVADCQTGDEDDKFILKSFHEATTVKMADFSDEIIKAYVDTGEPLDKAGSYGIQGVGGSLIEGIEGCYFNVMGFPLHRFCRELYNMHCDSLI